VRGAVLFLHKKKERRRRNKIASSMLSSKTD
jgi:hypothetical protein